MTHEELEKTVMDMLLAGDEEIFSVLRKQYNHAVVTERDFTGRGFFTTFLVPDSYVQKPYNGRIDDVKAVFPECENPEYHEAYFFILYVTDGKIDTLEGFSTLYDWKEDYDEVSIEYCFDDKRNYDIKMV